MSFLSPKCHGGDHSTNHSRDRRSDLQWKLPNPSKACATLCSHPHSVYQADLCWILTYVQGRRLEAGGTVPLRHNLVGIWQVTSDILHLSRVRVTDLVICPSVVGTLDHDDVCARTAELNGIALTGELSADHCHGNGGTAESWGRRERKKRHHHRHHCISKDITCIYFPSIWVNLNKG